MRRSSLLAGAVLVLIPTLAAAEQRLTPAGQASYFDFVATDANLDDLQLARQVLPPTSTGTTTTTAVLSQTKTIFLNRAGVTLAPGNNDARTNKSTIVSQTTAIGAWNTDATTWNATVACVRELFQPFAVTVVETR